MRNDDRWNENARLSRTSITAATFLLIDFLAGTFGREPTYASRANLVQYET